MTGQQPDKPGFDVEVAYALPQRQLIIPLKVSPGTTAIEAVLQSCIASHFEGLDPRACKLGIFGQVVSPGQPLRSGQRVEIYRPLRADPKEVRRQLAAQGKTMGGGRKSE